MRAAGSARRWAKLGILYVSPISRTPLSLNDCTLVGSAHKRPPASDLWRTVRSLAPFFPSTRPFPALRDSRVSVGFRPGAPLARSFDEIDFFNFSVRRPLPFLHSCGVEKHRLFVSSAHSPPSGVIHLNPWLRHQLPFLFCYPCPLPVRSASLRSAFDQRPPPSRE
jgi:hypothetical protein